MYFNCLDIKSQYSSVLGTERRIKKTTWYEDVDENLCEKLTKISTTGHSNVAKTLGILGILGKYKSNNRTKKKNYHSDCKIIRKDPWKYYCKEGETFYLSDSSMTGRSPCHLGYSHCCREGQAAVGVYIDLCWAPYIILC